MIETKNLWPEELFNKKKDVKTPLTILQKQVNYFNDSTSNLLVAELDSESSYSSKGHLPKVSHTLRISAPGFNNFYFDLAEVDYKNAFSYPLTIKASLTAESFEVHSNSEFEDTLSEVFRQESTVRIIQNSLIQTREKAGIYEADEMYEI